LVKSAPAAMTNRRTNAAASTAAAAAASARRRYIRACSIVSTGNRDRRAPSALMTVLRRAPLPRPPRRNFVGAKKTGPLRARPQVRQRGGASESPSRGEETANLRLPIWEDHGQSQIRQQAHTMQSDSTSHNVATGMPAMRCQHGRPDKLSGDCNHLVCRRDGKNAAHRVRSIIAKSKPDFGKDHAPTTFACGCRQRRRTRHARRFKIKSSNAARWRQESREMPARARRF